MAIQSRIDFMLLEACNFQNYPVGGSLSFAKQLLKTCDNIALVGITTDRNDPIGEWFEKEINGRIYSFFAFEYNKGIKKKTYIPKRFQNYLYLSLYRKKLFNTAPSKLIFTQSPQLFLVISGLKWESICYCFAGLTNSVQISKFKYLRWLSGFYEKRLFRNLKKYADVILAAADNEAISEIKKRQIKYLKSRDIIHFPTRYDPQIFYPKDQSFERQELNLEKDHIYFIVVGRLSWVKGWKLIIDSFRILNNKLPKSKLIFVGDGEDRQNIINYAGELYDCKLTITGYVSPEKVSSYLNAADCTLCGSYYEGWPTGLVEALAVGKPIVSTKVSSIEHLVSPGINGFICDEREPIKYSEYMLKVLSLTKTDYSVSLAQKYSLNTLKEDLINLWTTYERNYKKTLLP